MHVYSFCQSKPREATLYLELITLSYIELTKSFLYPVPHVNYSAPGFTENWVLYLIGHFISLLQVYNRTIA